MKLHVLRQIAPYPNNSLAQSPSKLIRSHAGDWIGGRHLSYSPRIIHYPVCPKPATTSRKDWHSAANGAVLRPFRARVAVRDPAPPARGATAAATAPASMKRLIVTRSSAIHRSNPSTSH